MPFLYTWNATFEGQPDDSEDANLGANRIRALKVAISERMEIDHSWAGDANDGLHMQVTMPQHASSPTVGSNQGAFYCKDSGGNTVPYFKSDSGTEYQLALQSGTWPIGSVFISVVSTNPATLLGFGTWVAFATGRTLVGIDTGNTLMDTVEETFGQADATNVAHTHSITDPGHTHVYTNPQVGSAGTDNGPGTTQANSTTNGGTTGSRTTGITVNSAGDSATNKNYQPSIVVYMWKRTA